MSVAFRNFTQLPFTTTVRRFSSHIEKNQTVPGLRFIPKFLNDFKLASLQKESLQLHHTINELGTSAKETSAKTYLSKQHNLKSKESYKLLTYTEGQGRINAQFFKHYGEDGHELTYFIGNKNIPGFIGHSVIVNLETLPEIQTLWSQSTNPTSLGAEVPRFNWNFTFNAYVISQDKPDKLPGFPFHIDAPFNGDISAILTLVSSAQLEMKKDDFHSSILLTPGSLLVLSGEARWKWQHRVLPIKNENTLIQTKFGLVQRISLVFGCQVILET